MKRKIYLIIVLIILVGLVAACNGVGNLRINVYNQQQSLMNDVYVGLYTADFKNRLDFSYTTRGEVKFKALEPGSYGVKIIKHNTKKRLRVQVKSEETNYLKVDLY